MPKQRPVVAGHVKKLKSPKRRSWVDVWLARASMAPAVLTLVVALISLGACCADNDGPRQFREGAYGSSFKTFARRADSGDSAAINFVGIHYYLGLGVARDLGAAARWFTRGARAGNADAQRNLGVLYLRGWGVRRDYEMAYGWLFEAINAGNRGAQNYLSALEITPNQTMRARLRVAQQLRQPAESAELRDAEPP